MNLIIMSESDIFLVYNFHTEPLKRAVFPTLDGSQIEHIMNN